MPACITDVGIAYPPLAGETFAAFPAHAQPTILRFCQEAHIIERNETHSDEKGAITVNNSKREIFQAIG